LLGITPNAPVVVQAPLTPVIADIVQKGEEVGSQEKLADGPLPVCVTTFPFKLLFVAVIDVFTQITVSGESRKSALGGNIVVMGSTFACVVPHGLEA